MQQSLLTSKVPEFAVTQALLQSSQGYALLHTEGSWRDHSIEGQYEGP